MDGTQIIARPPRQQPSLERLAAMLGRAFTGPDNPVDSIEWELAGEEGSIRCRFPLGPGPQQDRKSVCGRVGLVLAEYMLTEQEPALLCDIFERRYGLSDSVETDALIAEAVAQLDGEPEPGGEWPGRGRQRRQTKLAGQLAQYLGRHDSFHLDGYMRFRMRDYRKEVEDAAESAIEARLMDQQYEEFMSLLKTMVAFQESKTTAVHLLHAGGHAFRLLDENMLPLDNSIAAQGDQHDEDSRVVTRLLAASPHRLYIHTPEPESQVIRTIVSIFGERAALLPV